MQEHIIRVALAGQPNVGKSTLFNALTGLNQHVGNWPGKTIEQKTGTSTFNGHIIQIVDLPGAYSLTANSLEEEIARDYIIKEKPDVVVAVINAASLEHSLYLVAELLPLPSPVIVALNMIDVAESEGMKVEPQVLQAALGVPVVAMMASKGKGVRELAEIIDKLVEGRIDYQPHLPEIREDHQEVLEELAKLVGSFVREPYPVSWAALKVLEGDEGISRLVERQMGNREWQAVQDLLRQHDDAALAVVSGRYEWIGRMVRAAVAQPKMGRISLTERLDRWTTHPLWGLLILLGTLGLVFGLAHAAGFPLQEWLDIHVVHTAAQWLNVHLTLAPPWLTGLLADGVVGGAGTLLTFVPILILFFGVMSLLEDVGYMARTAFVMDRFMHLMGLHGKSFLPLFLGFGCNVPAVMGTRVVESERGRLLTILLTPLVPCTARLAILAFLTPIFFGRAAIIVSWGLVALNLLVLALAGVVMNQILLKGEQTGFIMELPLYHLPNWRTIGLFVWQRTVAFVMRAGTVVLVSSVIVWALAALPTGRIEESYLAQVGRLLSPLGNLMGLDWRMMVALFSSFVAKENSIATLGVLYGAGEQGLPNLLAGALSPLAALAFLVVEMLFIPCAATLATIRQETGSWRWTAFSVALLLLVSFLSGILVYQGGRLLGWGV